MGHLEVMFRPQHHINKINNRIYSLMVMVINNIFSQGIKKIGRGFHIDTSSRIEAYRYSKVYIGQDCVIGRCTNVKVRDAELIIGDRVAFNDNCNITVRNKITIGNDVLVGPNVVIIDHDHNYRSSNWKTDFISDEIYIGKNVWIGANSVICSR